MSTTEPKFTITARGVSPDPRGGHTEAEWDTLFAAVARADGAAIEALVTGTTSPVAKLDVDAIYKRYNAARAPSAIDAAGIDAARKALPAPKARPEPLANIHARMAEGAQFPPRKAAKL